MRLLFDTCTFLWVSLEPEKLSSAARGAFQNPDNTLFLSVSSVWEISIEHRLERLGLPDSPERYVPLRISTYGLQVIDISTPHALLAGALPPHHKDPFDRMLIAQAKIEELTVMTPDSAFTPYSVSVLW